MAIPWARTTKLEGHSHMNTTRKVAIALATAGLSLGLLGMTAPAQADSTWDYSMHK